MLAAALKDRGWTWSSAALPQIVPDTANVSKQFFFINGKRRTVYYQRLLSQAALFAKGLPSLAHDGTVAYYRCLLSLPDLRKVMPGQPAKA